MPQRVTMLKMFISTEDHVLKIPHPSSRSSADECCENPLVAFGVDEPNSSEPAKGLKEGVFQV